MPTDKEIETFIYSSFSSMFADNVDSGDIKSTIEEFKEFMSPYISELNPHKSIDQSNA
jgi:hypothetical protein